MPRHLYTFEDLNPDAGDHGSSGAALAHNFVWMNGQMHFGPKMHDLTQIFISRGVCLGSMLVSTETPYSSMYVLALRDELNNYEYWASDSVTTFHNCTGATTPSTAAAGDRISFAQFGDNIYATAGSGILQYMSVAGFRADPTVVNFADIVPASGGANMSCKHLVSHGGHLVAANVSLSAPWNGFSGHRACVWWSKFDDAQTFGSFAFTPEHKGSDYKILYDTYGEITGMCSTGEFVYIFKENAIYIGEGPPFDIRLLVNNIGTIWPGSILYHEGFVYFMSRTGPCRVSQNGVEHLKRGKTLTTHAHYLSANSLISTKYSAYDQSIYSDTISCTTAVDIRRNLVVFSYAASVTRDSNVAPLTGITNQVMHFYDISTGILSSGYLSNSKSVTGGSGGRNGFFHQAVLGRGDAGMVTLSDTLSIAEANSRGYPNINVISMYWDDGILRDENSQNVVYTKWLNFNQNSMTRIKRVRPIFSAGSNLSVLNCYVDIYTKPSNIYNESNMSPITVGGNVINGNGWIPISTSVFGREHCIAMRFDTMNGASSNDGVANALDSAHVGYMLGIEIEWETQGNKI